MKPFPSGPSLARPLVTRRLSLEPTNFDHLEGLWRAIEASLPELQPWMMWAENASLEETRSHIARCEKLWESNHADEWSFTVIRRGVPIGSVGIAAARADLQRAELGYWMCSALTGEGFMTEAASRAVAFAFDEIGLHRIELHAAPGNRGSIRVAEKLGFRFEGLARHAGFGGGDWQDMKVYGLLATDPRSSFHE